MCPCLSNDASPGLRRVGRDWLDRPVLDWETSEIECLCTPWTPRGASEPSAPSQSRAKIEVWREDIRRLWATQESPVGEVSSSGSTSDKPMQEMDPAIGNSDVDV